MHRSSSLLAAVAALALALLVGASAADAAPRAASAPVPSLTPKQTTALWRSLTRNPRLRPFAALDCRRLDAVFYAGTDWLRLATKLAANPSPCAQYSISVPPLAADKTQFRTDQAWRIRALGPSFHALAEINVTGWSGWVSTTGQSWYDAGVEARRRMAAAGFDVGAGDSWVVNEFSTAVRQGAGNARANIRAFVRGLHDGDGTLPVERGAVFITGMSQATKELSVYQARLQDWYEDEPFWRDMDAYVAHWSQELYGDVRNYAVPGADAATRQAALNAYLRHQTSLGGAAPASAAVAGSYLERTYNPLANAAWQWDAGFGWTNVPYDLMQHYVSAQTAAMRAAGLPRFGFAWHPKNLAALPSTDFNAQTDALLDRLAASIADSSAEAAGACGGTWCGGDLEGAWLNHGWSTFGAWKPSQLAFTSAPQTLSAGAVSAPMTVQLQTATGLAYTAGLPVDVELATSSGTGAFAPSDAGPWSRTLRVPIASGSSTVGFVYRDTAAGSPTLTASATGKVAGAQTQTVAAADTTAPETTLTAAPTGTVASTSATVSFGADEGGARFECSLDGSAYAACASPVSLSDLAQGAHAFAVRAIDAAGNVDGTPARTAWTVDTVAPETWITSAPDSKTRLTSATFGFAASEGGARFQCSLDYGAWVACASPTGYSGLTRTTHTFRVRALDAADNVDGSPAAYSWRIR